MAWRSGRTSNGLKRNRLQRIVRWTWRGLAALGIFCVLVTATPLLRYWAGALAGEWTDAPGDVLIVLGGSVLDDGTMGYNSYRRSVHAARIYQQGGFRSMIIVGGNKLTAPVSAAMRDFVVCRGIPREAVAIETSSQSTRENALFIRPLLANTPGRKVLFTSDYHMFRARRVFAKAGIAVTPRPFPDVMDLTTCFECRWQAFIYLFLESGKIGYYYVRGWI